MWDTSKLRGRIVEKYGSQLAFAEASKNSVSFISQYLNGHTCLDQKIIDRWVTLLEIPANEIADYFFKK